MRFTIGIFDKKTNRVVMEGAHVNHIGVMILLERLTGLDEKDRNKFLRDLIGLGVAEHMAEPNAELPYDITAMKI